MSVQLCIDDAVIRVYDVADNVIETHEHAGISRRLAVSQRARMF